MKYDARVCHFNMDTGCVELLLRDGRIISIDCTGVEDALDEMCIRDSRRTGQSHRPRSAGDAAADAR